MSTKKYLLDHFPHAERYWHSDLNSNLDITNITIGSHKEAWWQCEQRHAWLEIVKDFLKPKKVSCPYCDNRKSLKGFNDLATTHPELAKEWHSDNALKPTEVTLRFTKSVLWTGSCQHSWDMPISQRALKGRGCPYCAGQRVLVGFNDLATTEPELAKEWHPTKNTLTPQEITRGSVKKVWWQCKQDSSHAWDATPNGRSKGNGCPVCSGHRITASANDLATTHPGLIKEWHPTKNALTPQEVSKGSRDYIWWECEQGHEWKARVSDRATKNSGCPVCTNRRVLIGYNDLATTEPALAAQWHPTKNGELTILQVARGSCHDAWWTCDKGHEWKATIKNRVMLEQGCRRCNAALGASKAERELAEIIKQLVPDETVETSVYGVIKKELDIYVPSKNLAIEFNGVYWHSEAAGKMRNYHRGKQQDCAEKGITLYQVWEDDWIARKPVIIRGIAHRLGAVERLKELYPDTPDYYLERLGARKTSVRQSDYAEASAFLSEHHIQGSARGSLYLTLVDSQQRVRAVAVFKKGSAEGNYLIERYATAGVIAGGFTKLLKAAEQLLPVAKWITFADLSVSEGRLYEDTGFIAEKRLAPDYSYLVNGERKHKFGFRLKRFREDHALLYEEGLSERELALLNDIPRTWDSGKIRYVKVIDSE